MERETEREEVFLWLMQSRSLTVGAPVLPRQMLLFVSIPWQVEEHNQKEGALRYSGELYYELQPWRLKKKNNSSPIFSLFLFPYIVIEITPSFSQK